MPQVRIKQEVTKQNLIEEGLICNIAGEEINFLDLHPGKILQSEITYNPRNLFAFIIIDGSKKFTISNKLVEPV
jgi:hypothetical protein